jgi:hypothetical protein
MTRNDAIARADGWVRDRYPIVPPLSAVVDYRPDALAGLEAMYGGPFPSEDVRQVQGKWLMLYRCSWYTDELGMPTCLGVLIDDESGAAELLDFS